MAADLPDFNESPEKDSKLDFASAFSGTDFAAAQTDSLAKRNDTASESLPSYGSDSSTGIWSPDPELKAAAANFNFVNTNITRSFD